jgi:hypothetical protein
MAIEMLPEAPPAPDPNAIERRRLTPAEVDKFVKPYYDRSENPLPNPANSFFMGVVIGGDVVASLCIQAKLHAQPLIIENGYQSVLAGLVAEAEAEILRAAGPSWVYLFAPAGKLAQLATSLGMQMEPWVVMSKYVQPEQQDKGVIDFHPESTPPIITPEALSELEPEGLAS